MKNDISTEERIDNYILGRMTTDEVKAFEDDLESDSELKSEYESQKAISNSVQRVALREFLHECEQERSSARRIEVVGLRETIHNIVDFIKSFVSSGQRITWTMSAVAAMIVAVVGITDYSGISNDLQYKSVAVYAQLVEPTPRDGNTLDVIMADAYTKIGTDNYSEAEELLESTQNLITEGLSKPVVTEEDEYNHQIMLIKAQDVDWYSAIILMKRGKVFKAKKALKAIVAQNGIYSEDAQRILNEVYD